MLTPRQLFRCLYRAVANTVNHDGIEHAGYLAFLGLLALFPFLVFVVAVVGVIGQGEVGAEVISWLISNLPHQVSSAITPRIQEIISGPPQGLLTLSILGTIWTASSSVEGIRTVLNRAYNVHTPPAYLWRRLLSIVQMLFFATLLIAAMLLVVFVPVVFHNVESWLGIRLPLSEIASFGPVAYLFTLCILFFGVSYIYYVIPNIRQHFISVAPGAFFVVLFWMGAAYLFSLYLTNFEQVNLIYGSLGGVIAALLFFYLCNMIFIFGAEFNHEIVETLGLRVKPKDDTTAPAPTDSAQR